MSFEVALDRARARMIERHLAGRHDFSPAVLAAMRTVPRELFVPEALRAHAYDDGAMSIGHGQTISQPFIVALMAEEARIGPGTRVLEVGTGSGYAAAVYAELGARVVSIERIEALATSAREHLEAAGHARVEVHVADGLSGWPDGAPYDAIVIAAAGDDVPPALTSQLADRGRLVLPLRTTEGEWLVTLTRAGDRLEQRYVTPVAFVPLLPGVERTSASDD